MDVASRLKKILSDNFSLDIDEITSSSTMEDLELDSLDVVEITMSIEEEFDLEIPDEAVESIRTFGEAVDYLEHQLKPVKKKKAKSAAVQTSAEKTAETKAAKEPKGSDLPATPATADASCDILIAAAKPNLYRTNAFRIAALPVDATARDIAKQMEKLTIIEKTGLKASKLGGTLPIEPPPDLYAIRDAIQKLRDPEARLIDEFFWFWPHLLGQSNSDQAIQALQKNDLKLASSLWIKQENESSLANVSMHNLAVLSHTTALDLELSLNSTEPDNETTQQLALHWQQAFKRWRLLQDHEAFWSRLTERIREINDPRLPTGTTRRIRNSLPLALLLINAQLAVQAAEQGKNDQAKRHLAIMQGSGLGKNVIAEALRRSLDSVRQRIKMLTKTADQETNADPILANRAAQRFHDQVKPLLAVLDCLLPPGDPTRDGARDEVALQLLTCQITFGNRTEQWNQAESLLATAADLAVSSSAKNRIEDNRQIMRKNATLNNDYRGEGYFDLPQPVLDQLEAAHKATEISDYKKAISILKKLLAKISDQHRAQQEPLISKALAYCLNSWAIARLNAALEQYNQPPAIIAKITNRSDRLLYDINLRCMACGASIYGEYIKLTYKDVPLTICLSCNSQHDHEQNQRKSALRITIETIGKDLLRAMELDPDNNTIQTNYKDMKEMGANVSASLPTMPNVRLLRIKGGRLSVTALVKELKDKEYAIRLAAVEALEKFNTEAQVALPALVELLKENNQPLRLAILVALDKIQPSWIQSKWFEQVRPALKAMFHSGNAQAREQAQKILPVTDLVKELQDELKDKEYSIRLAAVEALGKLKTEAEIALPALVEMVKKNKPELRLAILDALDKIQPSWIQSKWFEQARPALVAMLRRGNAPARERAQKILLQIDPDLVNRIKKQRRLFFTLKLAAGIILTLLTYNWLALSAGSSAAAKRFYRIGLVGKDKVVEMVVHNLTVADKPGLLAGIKDLNQFNPEWQKTAVGDKIMEMLVNQLDVSNPQSLKNSINELDQLFPDWKTNPAAAKVLELLVVNLDVSNHQTLQNGINELNQFYPEWQKTAAGAKFLELLVNQLDVSNNQSLENGLNELDQFYPGWMVTSNTDGLLSRLEFKFLVAGDQATKNKLVQLLKQIDPNWVNSYPELKNFNFVHIFGGTFEMGDSDGASDERPVHRVTLGSFYMSQTEVTVAQYRAFCNATGRPMPSAPNWGWQENHPIVNVDWDDAVAFCKWVGARLPTEAEWEYAARSGGKQEKWSGTSNAAALDNYAWYDSNSGDQTHPVATKQPNALGVYDLSGNVWEWCADWYESSYYHNSPRDNPKGPVSGSSRVLRGGSWYYDPHYMRASNRYVYNPPHRSHHVGFRCVR